MTKFSTLSKTLSDKNWSFTDCSSKVVIQKLRLTQAFAFDHHFHQYGSLETELSSEAKFEIWAYTAS
jgi:predicted nucleic acid-binding protein